MTTKDTKKEWTVMVYMAGDNNLSPDMSYAMEHIRRAADEHRATVNLFVYYDGSSPEIPTLYCDYSSENHDKIFYRASKISKRFRDRRERPEAGDNEDSAKMYSALNFVDWCVNLVEHPGGSGRKAENYALVFAGHTAGFHSIGLFRDESTGYHMSMPKLRWLLERITEQRSADGDGTQDREEDANEDSASITVIGEKLAVLGFDSCAMGMLEVGYQFRDLAQALLVSEGNIPNAGWSYAEILGSIGKGKADGPTAAEAIVHAFIAKQDNYSVGGVAVDMAAWDLAKLPELDEPLADLALLLRNCLEDKGTALYRQVERMLLQAHWRCQTYMFDQNVDLLDLCSLLKKEAELVATEIRDVPEQILAIPALCDHVIRAIRNIVILSGFSGGTYQFSNGISLFFPWSATSFLASERDYCRLRFVDETKAGRMWTNFLAKYLLEVTLRPGQTPTVAGPSFAGGMSDVVNLIEDTEEDTVEAGVVYRPYVYKTEKWVPEPSDGSDTDGSDAETRVPDNPKTRVPDNPKTRVPDNPKTRVPDNPKTRVPDNPKTRMFGSLASYFDQLFAFKNIRTDWNISGFTKDVSDLETRTGDGPHQESSAGIDET